MAYALRLLGCMLSADVALRMCTAAAELRAERHYRSPYVHCSFGLQAKRRCRSWFVHGIYWAAYRASPSLSVLHGSYWLLGCVLNAAIALRVWTAAVEWHAERHYRSPYVRCSCELQAERRRRSWLMHGSYWAAC